MKILLTSTVLTLAAVPFLVAAPAAKKAQNSSAPAKQSEVAPAKPMHKKHVKKAQKSAAVKGDAATPATSTPAK